MVRFETHLFCWRVASRLFQQGVFTITFYALRLVLFGGVLRLLWVFVVLRFVRVYCSAVFLVHRCCVCFFQVSSNFMLFSFVFIH